MHRAKIYKILILLNFFKITQFGVEFLADICLYFECRQYLAPYDNKFAVTSR